MAQLIPEVRKGNSYLGKPRVYFCAHPEDQEQYFHALAKEILVKQNCAIWRLDDPFDEIDVATHLAKLGDMQLFVIPVTQKLLTTDNRAINIEIPFALDKNIPILPIMCERNLSTLFNEKCGHIQCLEKVSTGPAPIPYDKKLAIFLSSTLVGDEQIEKIRQAFFANVFLSYRKKDRLHAKELMKLIHQNDACRDVAIWYDEFLIPGENFDEGIKNAIKSSDVFAVAVTPNIVNEKNYVLTTELPIATELNKPILSIEMVATDKSSFGEGAEVLRDQLIDGYGEQLSDTILREIHKVSSKENVRAPLHDFYIGLAYLYGINMEVDRDRAISLITASAEAGEMAAIEKLIDIYQQGIGVKRDINMATKWLNRFLDILVETLAKTHTVDDAINFFMAIFRWCDNALGSGDYKTAQNIIDNNMDLARHLASQIDGDGGNLILAEMLNWKAGFLRDNGQLKRARQLFDETVELLLPMRNGEYAKEVCHSLADIYTDLSILADKEGDHAESREWNEKSYHTLREGMELFDGDPAFIYSCASCCTMLLIDSARSNNQKDLKIWKDRLAEHIVELEEAGADSFAFEMQAYYDFATGLAVTDDRERQAHFQKTLNSLKTVAEEKDDIISLVGIGSIYYSLAESLCQSDNAKDAYSYYSEGLSYFEKARDTGANARRIEFGISQGLMGMGEILLKDTKDEATIISAIEKLEQSIDAVSLDNCEEPEELVKRLKAHLKLTYALMLLPQPDYEKIFTNLDKALAIKESLPNLKLSKDGNNILALACNLRATYIYEKQSFSFRAVEEMKRAIDLYLVVLADEDNNKTRNAIVTLCDTLSSIYILKARSQGGYGKLVKKAVKNYYQEAEYYKKMAEEYKKGIKPE